GCTDAEYIAEVARATQALATSGASLESSLEREREGASEALDFERAAALHKKIEKLSEAMKHLPEIARRVDQLDAVILQRAAEDNSVAIFAVHKGLIAEPFFLRFGELSSQPRSVEAILREHLEGETNPLEKGNSGTVTPKVMPGADEAPTTLTELRANFGQHAVPEQLQEHLSLLARWFYAKPREGEIFYRGAEWPYRRLLRACARILAPPGAAPPATSTS
ncbi:MAG TPA: UvrB/UvrC motif-containing protein, partial [Candidatus Acidoferrales bacterium]|nr:UvrB/UvrC motif-containing protein [Candidatus Acidoferrales bacterium]